jgi:hypothetical protein
LKNGDHIDKKENKNKNKGGAIDSTKILQETVGRATDAKCSTTQTGTNPERQQGEESTTSLDKETRN